MSSSRVSNKQLISFWRPSCCFLTAAAPFGSGIAILSNSSLIKMSASFITTPLMFLVIPFNFLLILSAEFLTSKATSRTSPVCLSINSPTSFWSILRANFMNSLITFSILVEGSPPHLPSARFTEKHLSFSTNLPRSLIASPTTFLGFTVLVSDSPSPPPSPPSSTPFNTPVSSSSLTLDPVL